MITVYTILHKSCRFNLNQVKTIILLTNASSYAIITSIEQSVRGVRVYARVKREAGANPARTRRCKAEVLRHHVTGHCPGRRRRAMIAKSEDLPGMKLDSHESLAENMRFRPGILDQMFLACVFARAFSFPSFPSGREYGSVSFPHHTLPDQERNTS